jgi:MFS family permease
LRFVLLIGVVSGFSDMTHEGARGITGPFLGSLHASPAVIAGVAGFGELLGYALRFVAGYAADRSRRYWTVTFVGYSLQMAVVPLLALAGNWPVAALLIVAERVGRAIRNPARDAMLAHATGELGKGWVFGLREALDAGGAMLGPLLVALVLYAHGGYRDAFAFLAIPAALTLVTLTVTRREYPAPADLEVGAVAPTGAGLPRAYWTYLAAMGLVALGYADFPLIAYHFEQADVVSTAWIPVLYAVAMATEAVAALGLGRLFDRLGLRTVAAATLLTAAFAPLVFYGNAVTAVLGTITWGVGMAAQESIVKAVITGMVPSHRRASAYGLFDTGFGVFWFVGSVTLGVLYGRSLAAVVAFSVAVQLAAIPLLLITWGQLRGRTGAPSG